MSCVVGVKSNGHVYLGADGFATTEDGERRPIIADKLIRNKHYLIGYTGSVRTGQILDRHNFDIPDRIEDFADAAREHMYAKGCVATTDGGIQMQTCNLLIAYGDRLFELLMDFQLNEVLGNYTAIGSGAAYAMGAMYVLEKSKLKPMDQIEIALKAAACFHTSVGPPYDYEYI